MTQVDRNLAGKVALVTGGGRGIGGGISTRLAAHGAFVIVNYNKDRASAESKVAAIEAAGGRAVAMQADVGSVDAIKNLYNDTDKYLTSTLGSNKIDILVNNACAIWPHGLDANEDTYTQLMAVNLKGPFFMATEILPRMPDGGRIINISSASAKSAHPVVPLYSIAKHGITGLTRNLALALGPRKICVNGVEPGFTMTDALMENMKAVKGFISGSADDAGNDIAPERTELPPELPGGGFEMDDDLSAVIKQSVALGRMGGPSDIAAVVAFLASDAGGWVTGQSIPADGGLKL